MNKKILYIYLVFTLIFSGCKERKEDKLYGTWIAKYPFGTEKLVLNSNGKCSQYVNVDVNGVNRTATNEGKWKYDPKRGYLIFEDVLMVRGEFGSLNKDYNVPFSGNVDLPLCLSLWGPPKIEINPDCGYYYVKISDSNTTNNFESNK